MSFGKILVERIFYGSHRCARLGRRPGLWEVPRAAAFPAELRFVPRERSETAKRCKARARLRAALRATNLEREMLSLAGLAPELKRRYSVLDSRVALEGGHPGFGVLPERVKTLSSKGSTPNPGWSFG